MSVTLSEVRRAAKAHRAPLAGESAGYLVLAIADQVLSAPRLVQAADVQLTEEGGLRVLSGHASSDADAELSLRRALDQLLLVASSGSAALTRASRRTEPTGLSTLVRELEAALIPVNRAAARRALARVHRETARALASGALPEEETQAVLAAPAAALAPPVVAARVPVPAPAPVLEPEPVQDEQDEQDELQTRALPLPLATLDESRLDGVLSALCDELPAPPELEESEPLTIALDVCPATALVQRALALDEDVEIQADEIEPLELESEDSSAAPTVMRAVEVEPVVLSAFDADEPATDLPAEVCTRPEPVVLRKSMRPAPQAELLPPPPTESEAPLARTPTLGSLAAQLPVLAPEQIAELSLENEQSDALTCAMPEVEAQIEIETPRTEPMPEVEPLPPGVAMVASRKSDVSELVSSFQIAPSDPSQAGLCRAIKEMADLDLTPAPFAALIRVENRT